MYDSIADPLEASKPQPVTFIWQWLYPNVIFEEYPPEVKKWPDFFKKRVDSFSDAVNLSKYHTPPRCFPTSEVIRATGAFIKKNGRLQLLGIGDLSESVY